MGLTQFDENYPFADVYQIGSGAGTSPGQDFYAIRQNIRVDRIMICSDDTVDHDITLWWYDDGTPANILGTVAVPAGAGLTSAVPSVDVFAALPHLADGLIFRDTQGIGFQALVAVSAGKIIYVTSTGGLV